MAAGRLADRAGSAAASGPAEPALSDASVLVVSDLTNTVKMRRHWGPLVDVAGRTTMVCLEPDDDVPEVDYRVAPTFGSRYVGLALLAVVALRAARRGDHDAVSAISLFPYGLVALLVGAVAGIPTHLGIIGIDADRHATAWYGPLVRALFRRFDVVSVPGTAHVDALAGMGVPRERLTVLANAIDVDVYRPTDRPEDPAYDLVWAGRFSAEKDPLTFVRALAALRDAGVAVDAVMLGDGPMDRRVRRALERHGLGDAVELPGWVEEPAAYYRRSAAFVLTSRREGLPLTLLEAMATGVAPVVVPVGSVTDVARDGETAVVADDRTPAALAAAIERVVSDDDLRERLAANAPAVRSSYGYDAARADWRRILRVALEG